MPLYMKILTLLYRITVSARDTGLEARYRGASICGSHQWGKLTKVSTSSHHHMSTA